MPSSLPPTSTTSSRVSSRARPTSFDAPLTIEFIEELLELLEKVYAAKIKAKNKSKLRAGQTTPNAVKTDLETKAKKRGEVDAGRSKRNSVKTHLENGAKMKAAETGLETKINATGIRKAEIKGTTARAAKISKNQAPKNEARPQKVNNGKDQQKGRNTPQQYLKGCLKDPKLPSTGQKKTVRFNLPEDDFGSRCKLPGERAQTLTMGLKF